MDIILLALMSIQDAPSFSGFLLEYVVIAMQIYDILLQTLLLIAYAFVCCHFLASCIM